MPFATEPTFTHGTPPQALATTAILFCNLGTPDEPTAPALRRYLGEFLSDARVVEIPRALWWLIPRTNRDMDGLPRGHFELYA